MSDPITVRQCLTHTGGIAHPDDWGWDQPEFDDGALERHVRTRADRAILDIPPGTLEGARILAAERYETMWTVQVHEPGKAIESALGWWVRRGSELIVEHHGEDDGFSSHL